MAVVKNRKFSVKHDPVATIESIPARLSRPESIAFAPSGELKAVANSGNNSISVYRRRYGGNAGEFESTPCCMVMDDKRLNYVHGVDFSPDSRFIVAVGKFSHSLALFECVDNDAMVVNPEPVCFLQGIEYGLSFPADVAFHPSGKNLIVANRTGSLTFYQCVTLRNKLLLGYNASRSVSREWHMLRDIAPPHGVTYSADGRWLIACHSKFYESGEETSKEGRSALTILRLDEVSNRLDMEQPEMIQVVGERHYHSVAMHPAGTHFAATNCRGGTTLYELLDDPCRVSSLDEIPHVNKRGSEGPKGLSFTRDGARLEISNTDDEIRVYQCSV